MATEDPSIGYGAEFWLANAGAVLTELVGVFNMGLPNDQADPVEVTHYKSPQKRKEYIDGLTDAGDLTVEMNYAPGSATDVLVREARAAGTVRAFKQVLTDGNGDPWEITGTCIVRGYERNIPNGDRKAATMTIRVSGAVDEAAG